MFDRHTLWRHFITSLPLQALTIGVLATLLARMLWLTAPATVTALDWTVYDTWLRHRALVAISPTLTIVARDPVSEAQFGTGPWDRAVLAQLITTAHETGAAAIGIDQRLNHASPAHLGGAASDALLLEATKTAGHIVTVFDDEAPLASDAIVQGHLALSPHGDHVARSLPLFVEHGSQTLPSFGLALFSLAKNQPLSHGTGETRLVNVVGNGTLADLPTIPLSNVWKAIRQQDSTSLDGWLKDKVVVILSQAPSQSLWLLPTGQSVDGMTAQLQFLNSLLTENHLCQIGPFGRTGITMVVATLIAWCLLRFHGSISLVFAAGAIALYAAMTAIILGGLHLVLPVALPLTAALIVLLGTTAWTHLTAGQRLVLL
ncbi:MAG: CHASE2 domain-containing protein, partial [Nitrospirota bacterium]